MQPMTQNAIGRKLKKWYIVNSVMLLLSLSIFCILFVLSGLKDRGAEELRSLTAVLGQNSTAAIAFEDKEAANEILSALVNQRKIDAAFILNTEGELFAKYVRSGLEAESFQEIYQHSHVAGKEDTPRHRFDEHGLHQVSPIWLNGELIGHIHAIDNLVYIHEFISAFIMLAAIIILFLMAIAYWISVHLQRVITDPIVTLKNTMDTVSSNKQYNIEVTFDSQDEIGDLYKGFNSMLKEVYERDLALKQHNEHLEQEVLKRTEEIHIANEKLGQYIARANEARDKAEELAKAKSLFLANMSHEIRTPLNGVVGIVEILSKTNLDDKQREFVSIAQTSSLTLLEIINDVLDFSKIDSEQLDLESRLIDVRSIVESVAVQFATSANQKGVELLCNTGSLIHHQFYGDELRIKQILSNLISNAIKFTHKGEIVVACTDVKPLDDGYDELSFEVSDTGVGIHPDSLEKIFDAFTQEDQSTTRKFGGTGLGLNICKKLISLMRGNIKVKSELNKGSTFSFSIVLKRGEALVLDTTNKVDLHNLRILIVDDSPVNCQILSAYMQGWQIQNEIIKDPLKVEKVLIAAKQDGEPFDLVLLDYHMPHCNGVDLAKRISLHPDIAHTDIIILSSIMSTLNLDELHGTNIKAHLSKPIKHYDLLKSITEVCFHKKIDVKPNELEPTARNITKNLKILVAEDYEINQQIIKIMLENIGCQVTIASHGLEAFELYKKMRFDLIFMDCQMPVLDGFDTTHKIRVLEQNLREKTPIIALTGNVTKEDKQKCFDCGMNDYVKKPYSEHDIIQVLYKWTSQDLSPSDGYNHKPEESSQLFDENQFKKLASLDKEDQFTVQIIDMFKDSTENKITCVLDALSKRDYEQIRSIAHMLKTSCASVGAAKLSLVFKEIDQKIKGSEFDEIDELCKQLRPTFHKTIEAIKKYQGDS